jgi:hypothetical protein
MASDGVDPVTGAKKFPESGALQSGADLEEVSLQAVTVGTRLIGTTAQMNAYPHARKKLRWGNTTNGLEYEHTGTGWKPVSSTKGLFADATLANGDVFVVHGLGVIPSAVFTQDRLGVAGSLASTRKLVFIGASNVQAQFVVYQANGQPAGGLPVEFFWEAHP